MLVLGYRRQRYINTSTPFSFTGRHTLRPTCGPPYFQNCCCQLNVVRPASSFEGPMDSTSPRTPLIEWSFMTSRRMAPGSFNYVLQTSPGDPTSRCDQNETRWPLSSTCTDTDIGELLNFKGCATWASFQRGSSASALSECLLTLDLLPFLVFPFCAATMLSSPLPLPPLV